MQLFTFSKANHIYNICQISVSRANQIYKTHQFSVSMVNHIYKTCQISVSIDNHIYKICQFSVSVANHISKAYKFKVSMVNHIYKTYQISVSVLITFTKLACSVFHWLITFEKSILNFLMKCTIWISKQKICLAWIEKKIILFFFCHLRQLQQNANLYTFGFWIINFFFSVFTPKSCSSVLRNECCQTRTYHLVDLFKASKQVQACMHTHTHILHLTSIIQLKSDFFFFWAAILKMIALCSVLSVTM